MSLTEQNKQVIQRFLQTVWIGQDGTALGDFWTDDCINHAQSGLENRGLAALRAYHDAFFADFAAFSEVRIEITQQIAEGDRVATHILSRGRHTGPFFGIPPTGKTVSLATIRLDRLRDGKIAEHWSVADVASLMAQLQG